MLTPSRSAAGGKERSGRDGAGDEPRKRGAAEGDDRKVPTRAGARSSRGHVCGCHGEDPAEDNRELVTTKGAFCGLGLPIATMERAPATFAFFLLRSLMVGLTAGAPMSNKPRQEE